jgi:ATP-dependent helicase HrpB
MNLSQLNLSPLPIDTVTKGIAEALKKHDRLTLQASPGSGKTTRLPVYLSQHFDGKILILEPRRFAAKLAAERIAQETNTQVGEFAGYRMRGESKVQPHTKIIFITEGILPTLLASDPVLTGVSLCILDEFHERHSQTDFGFVLLEHLKQTTRPDLKILVMSATLNAALSHYERISFELPQHEVTIKYAPCDYKKDLFDILKQNSAESTLIFLPTIRDVDDSVNRAMSLFRNHLVCGLHSRSSHSDLAFRPSEKPKLVFATNIAESSVTIPDITCVIDSGLVRRPLFDPWNGSSVLETRPAAQDSLVQRAGRAGRVKAGLVIRLFSEIDFKSRPEAEAPEIQRTDLTTYMQSIRALGSVLKDLPPFDKLPWVDMPPAQQVIYATQLLNLLKTGDDTPVGINPRVAAMVSKARSLGVASEGVVCAAIATLPLDARLASDVDQSVCGLSAVYDSYRQRSSFTVGEEAVRIASAMRTPLSKDLKPSWEIGVEEIILAGFPDRVAAVQRNQDTVLAFCQGGFAKLSGNINSKFCVALQTDVYKKRPGDKSIPVVSFTAAISEETLIMSANSLLTESKQIVWNDASQRAEQQSVVKYGQLTVEEERRSATPGEAKSILPAKLVQLWEQTFEDHDTLDELKARVEACPGLAFDMDRGTLAETMCEGRYNLKDLGSLQHNLLQIIPPDIWNHLHKYAPTSLKLSNGEDVRIHYKLGQDPWIEVIIQALYGIQTTPVIGSRLLQIHLLAPNKRPVQVTKDLASFWKNAYPPLKKEYDRRYPRHNWPENPLTAKPTRHGIKPKP